MLHRNMQCEPLPLVPPFLGTSLHFRSLIQEWTLSPARPPRRAKFFMCISISLHIGMLIHISRGLCLCIHIYLTLQAIKHTIYLMHNSILLARLDTIGNKRNRRQCSWYCVINWFLKIQLQNLKNIQAKIIFTLEQL